MFPRVNMRQLTPSRKRLKPGDVFVLQMRPDEYIFGRVIHLEARVFAPGGILIYIYNAFSREKTQLPMLDRNNLLIPPKVVNRLGWSRGYFETVAHVSLKEEDVFDVHCFFRPWDQTYRDEFGRRLPGPVEPCGGYGLGNYRTVDDAISEALGIPLVPDE